MGIRTKILLPSILLFLSLSAAIHLYMLPQFEAMESESIYEQQSAYLKILSSITVPALLTQNRARIHEIFDAVLTERSQWAGLQLYTSDGTRLYPMDYSPQIPIDNGQLVEVTKEITENEQIIGHLTAQFNFNAILNTKLAHLRHVELVILSILFLVSIVSFMLLNTWIRKPLVKLAKNAHSLTNVDTHSGLESPSADEICQTTTALQLISQNIQSTENYIHKQHDILNVISEAQLSYIGKKDRFDIFKKILADILVYTKSEYGFVGEVGSDAGRQYIITYATSDATWGEESVEFSASIRPDGLNYNNVDAFYGLLIGKGKIIIVNNDDEHVEKIGIRKTTTCLKKILGIPLVERNKVVGVFGLINGESDYDEQLIEEIRPIFAACTSIILDTKNHRAKKLIDDTLRDKAARINAILNTVADGIITTNDKGEIESFNHAAETLFGYSSHEVIGCNANMLMPDPQLGKFDNSPTSYQHYGESFMLAGDKQLLGIHKNGSLVPVEIAVTEMRIGDALKFTAVIRDITERKKMERLKDEFISTVSHELRTPLTSIKGTLGLLGGGVMGELSAAAQQLFDLANDNCDRLVRLINDVLDIQKIESGNIDYKITQIDIVKLVKKALIENEGYARQCKVRFSLQNKMQKDLQLDIDEDRIRQVLDNLLSNAAKFSPSGSEIIIIISENDQQIKIAIVDKGPGISKEFESRLFQKFTQQDSSDTRQKAGTGLGLNISKAIVEDHHGQINFYNNKGGGATFYFELPLPKYTTREANVI